MKYKKFYIIILTLLFLNYIYLIYQFNFRTINIHPISTALLLVPIIIMLLIIRFNKKEKIKDKMCTIFFVILVIISIVLNFITFVYVLILEGTSYETNPLKYDHILKISQYKEYIYQFPNKIPKELIKKNKIKFYYSPQFLQGGFNLELLIELDGSQIEDYISKYEENIKEIIIVDNEKKVNLYRQYGMNEPYEVLEDEECKKFFDGCIVYLLENKPYKPDNWNHGYVVYMAKNMKLNQLLIVSQVW